MYFIAVILVIIGDFGKPETFKLINENFYFNTKAQCQEYLRVNESIIRLSIEKAFNFYNLKLESIEKVYCENPNERQVHL